VTRGPATWATVVALALINVGLATAIVAAMGSAAIAPLWVGIGLVALGIVAALVAVGLWRQYLVALREQ
jgi:membrane protein YdbS with pleckstrin-like domain